MVTQLDAETAHDTLEALDDAGFPVGMAMIVNQPDGSRYLNIYSGRVDLQGPAQSYRALRDVISSRPGLVPLPMIRLLPFARSAEAQMMRGAFQLGGRSAVSLVNSNINGILFEDVILLRTPSS